MVRPLSARANVIRHRISHRQPAPGDAETEAPKVIRAKAPKDRRKAVSLQSRSQGNQAGLMLHSKPGKPGSQIAVAQRYQAKPK
jgi:hypothetical protein